MSHQQMFREGFLFLVGGVVGAVLCYVLPIHNTQPHEYIVREGGYEFINPLISCNLYEDNAYSGFASLHDSLMRSIRAHIQNGDATKISAYFRDMDNGYWTGINYDDKYIAASLVKVPYLITMLRQDRDDTSLLKNQLIFSTKNASPLTEHYAPSERLVDGRAYTLQDLMERMIIHSDNDATLLLANKLDPKMLADVYSNFGVAPLEDPDVASISPADYSRFFRILYNASYLGRVRSQTALKLLSQTTFTDGLMKGVPAGTTVAHKFGERTEAHTDGTSTMSLHDCGIIYYPHSPYVLCVMTEGTDFTVLSSVIGDLSTQTYTAVRDGLFTHEPSNE